MTPQVKPGKEIPVHLTAFVLLLKRVNASDKAGNVQSVVLLVEVDYQRSLTELS